MHVHGIPHLSMCDYVQWAALITNASARLMATPASLTTLLSTKRALGFTLAAEDQLTAMFTRMPNLASGGGMVDDVPASSPPPAQKFVWLNDICTPTLDPGPMTRLNPSPSPPRDTSQ